MKTQNPIPRLSWIDALPDKCEQKTISEMGDKLSNQREIDELREDYISRMILLDSQVSELVNSLRDREDNKNTAICITSDHGEMLGDAGMLYKGSMLESSINVPFIYKEPESITFKTRERIGSHPFTTTDALAEVVTIFSEVEKQKFNWTNKEAKIHNYRVWKRNSDSQRSQKIVMSTIDGEPYWATNLQRIQQKAEMHYLTRWKNGRS